MPASADPAEVAMHGRNLAALGLIHLRHAAAPRAMVLGLAAMAMGDLRPRTVLMVAEALLQAGDPEQAMTALARFDRHRDTGDGYDHGTGYESGPDGASDEGLSDPPTAAEDAARHYLTARILLRQGRGPEARAALERALERGGLGSAPGDPRPETGAPGASAARGDSDTAGRGDR